MNTGRRIKVRALSLVAAGAGCMAVISCAPLDDASPAAVAATSNGDDLYRVNAETTSFFKNGPQQPSGPDLALKKDTRVVMVKRNFGYSQVRTADNQVGYVGTVDLTPLSAEELAAEKAQQAAALKPATGRNPAIVGEYSIPPEAGNREKLPEPEAKPTPNPAMFHY